MLLLGLLFMLVSSYQLFIQRDVSTESKVLGELSHAFSVVKMKHALNLDWRDASVGFDVTENQLIFTNSEASAEISFTQGGKLRIGENSLIKVTANGDEAALNIERGIVRAKLDGTKPMVVAMNGQQFELKGDGAEVQINLKGEKGEIGVLSGDLTVESEEGTQALNADTMLAIEGKTTTKKKVTYKLQSPDRGQTYYTTEAQFPVTFNWAPADAAKITISKEADLAGGETFEWNPGVTRDLPPGTYYWRVETDQGPSLTGTFKILSEVPPVVIRPLTGEGLTLIGKGEAGAALILEWESARETRWLLQTETAAGLDEKIISGSSAVVHIKEGGDFRWRLRLEDAARPMALWSPWQELKLTVAQPPPMPLELAPDGAEYQVYQKGAHDVDLSWKSQGLVELEVLPPKGRANSQKVEGQSFTFKAATPGEHRWRLRAVDEFDRTSDWTEWKTFTLMDLSDSSHAGAHRIQLKRPDQQVTFDWQGDEDAETVFELSRDENFKDVVIKRELKTRSTKTVIPKTGVYYWRSRQISTDGTVNVSEPVKVIVEPAPAPGKPEKLPDVDVPIEWKVIDQKSTFNILDLIFPSAYADEVKGTVTLTVPKLEDAKAVVIRLYRDEALTDLALETKFEGTSYTWEGANPGSYYWQYAVIDHWDRQSPFSDPSRLTVTGDFVAPAERPRLLSPIRAQEVKDEEISFRWRESEGAKDYVLEVSRQEDFRQLIEQKTVKDDELEIKTPPEPGLYYWRLRARNEIKQETLSNTGRFTVAPPLEKFTIADQFAWKKDWRSRAFVAWSPSQDSYTFKDGSSKGTIAGRALNGVELKGTRFGEKWIFNGELLRQSGKVFEGESYLFQRFFVDALWNKTLQSGARLGFGLGVGHTSGMSYAITGTEVASSSSSGIAFGPVFRSFHPISANYEVQTKALYFLGGIKQMEIGADLLKAWKRDMKVLFGASYATRTYDVGSGAQASLRLSLGLGKEF